MKKPTAESMSDFKLIRNASGELSFTSNEGLTHNGVYPVRAFPISAPEDGLSLFDANGHEVAWIENLSNVSDQIRLLIADELALREFMPTIYRILHVNSFATPSTWQLETDRGNTELTIKTEDSIRRLTLTKMLITDSHGIHFLIPNIDELDQHSRKLLDRFL
ncbi:MULTISPECIES: cyanophycin metabolism-associated DUF1854 family protein [Methylotenera]|uniref:cyanophycin metabolism-associated DUF1854 family protein n=1 Tax=Methylotenera TaxID=359407 RepID=UPI00035E4C3C|nr:MULTISPECIES: DUF1854 domain-containing protein [Methylotenera]